MSESNESVAADLPPQLTTNGFHPSGLPDVFHYTTVESAVAILSSSKLRLCSAVTMNDHSEGSWLSDQLRQLELERSEARGAPRSLVESERLQDLWNSAFGGRAPFAYVSCFSELGDSLSQWRAYADDGAGVAIGFDLNDGNFPLCNSLAVPSLSADHACSVQQVRYVDRHSATDLVADFDFYIANGHPHHASGRAASKSARASLQLSAARWMVKNPAFSEEREWRIINLPLKTSAAGKAGGTSLLSEIGKVGFYASRGRIVSFYEIKFDPQSVRSVRIGPCSEVSESELDLLLRAHGYTSARITRSEATYRR